MSTHDCKFQSFIQLCKLSCDEIFDFFCHIRCGKSLVLMGLDPSSVGSVAGLLTVRSKSEWNKQKPRRRGDKMRKHILSSAGAGLQSSNSSPILWQGKLLSPHVLVFCP